MKHFNALEQLSRAVFLFISLSCAARGRVGGKQHLKAFMRRIPGKFLNDFRFGSPENFNKIQLGF